MNGKTRRPDRRNFILSLTAAGILSYSPCGRAAGSTAIAALDETASILKSPETALLVAITATPSGRLVATGEHGVILYSDDAGASWTQAEVPVDVTLTCVGFATASLGWAAGHFGVIVKTLDGGKTWHLQLNGMQANQLTLQAAQNPDIGANPSPAAPLALVRAQHFVADGPDKPFLTLLVADESNVMVFGAYRLAMRSIDGGASWQDWSLHIYDQFSHNIYAAASYKNIDYLVGEMGLVFASKDNANSFLPVPSPGAVTLFGLLMAKDGALIAFGVAGAAFRSADGGASWQALAVPTQSDLTAGRLLASGSIVLSSEAGAIFKSEDNAMTFTQIPGVQAQPLFDLQPTKDGSLIAVGEQGIVRISKTNVAT